MDWSIVHALNAFLVHHDAIEDPTLLYERASEALFAGMLIVAFVVGPRRTAVAAGLSAGLALAIGKLLSILVDRPRPFVAHPGGVHLFAAHAADAGFPSDHATAAFAIAVAILLRHRAWGGAVLVAAALVAAGRVAIGVHYPTDVLAGAALGSACALALYAGRHRVGEWQHAVLRSARRSGDRRTGRGMTWGASGDRSRAQRSRVWSR